MAVIDRELRALTVALTKLLETANELLPRLAGVVMPKPSPASCVLKKLAVLRPRINVDRQAYGRLSRGLVYAVRHARLDLDWFDLNDLDKLMTIRGIGTLTALRIQGMPRCK